MGATGTGIFAGCLGDEGSSEPGDGASRPSTPSSPSGLDDVELPVPSDEMRTALPRDHIPAIVEPVFADDWDDVDADEDTTLPIDAPVIGVERDGRSRAYPLRVLDWHEIANDDLGGPISVTYCVLCGSSVVVERYVDGEPTIFGVSGKLWKSDLVMYDEATDSLWSQLLATAIRGPQTGRTLRIVQSTLTTWGEWREMYPDTEVLLPPPESNTVVGPGRTFDYFEPKYGYGDESQLVGRDSFDGDLHSKTMVVGIRSDGEARAYPYHVVVEEDPVVDRIGESPVVVSIAPDDTLVAYDRRVEGRTLEFEGADERHLEAGGSRWERASGVAVDGPYRDTELGRANDLPPMFWLGWSNFNPESDVYGIDVDDVVIEE